MLKKILIAFIGLLLLLLIVPNFINWNQYKKPILEQVELHSGLKVDISGDIGFSFFPLPKLQVTGITIKNPPGGQGENIATIQNLDLSVELLPLLSGQVNVSKVTLVEPKIYLEKRKSGEGNWQSLIAQKQTPSEEKKSSASTSKALNLSFHNISIQGGSLSYHDMTSKKTTEIKALNLAGSVDSLQGPFSAQMDFDYDGYQMKADVKTGLMKEGSTFPEMVTANVAIHKGKDDYGNITLTGQHENNTLKVQVKSNMLKIPFQTVIGSKKIDLEKGMDLSANVEIQGTQYKVHALKATFDGLSLSGNGVYHDHSQPQAAKCSFEGSFDLTYGKSHIHFKVGDGVRFKGDGDYQGNVNIQADQQSDLLSYFGLNDLKNYMGNRWSVFSMVGIKGSRISLGKLHIKTEKIACHGEVVVDLSKKTPYIKANLRDFPVVDSAAFAAATNHNNQSTKSSNERWSRDPIDLSFLKSIDLDLTLNIAQLHHKPYQLSHVRVTTQIKNGHLNLSKEGKGYGGHFKVNASLTPDHKLSLHYDMDLNVVSLPGLQGTPLKKGTLATSAHLQGNASSVYNLVNSLSGQGKLRLSHGVVEAFDVKKFIADLKNTKDLSGLSQLQDNFKKKALVNFSHFHTDFSLQKGIAHTQNLELMSDDVVIRGKGDVNLPQWSLDLKTLIQIKELKLPPLGLNINGSIDSPHFALDQTQLAKIVVHSVASKVMNKAVDQVQKQLTQQLPIPLPAEANKAVTDVIGNVLSGVLGGGKR